MNMETGTMIEGEAEAPVDFESEAKKMGWTPLDEFKGDPKHHLDAETFYTRAVEYMPIAKATIKNLSRRLDQAERDTKRASEFFSKAEERAYNAALETIRAEQEAAVESGDLAAHRAAAAKLDKLEKPEAAPKDEISDEQRAEEFADWGKENKWYATNPIMQAYADSQAQILAKAKGGILNRADLDTVAERVKAKFGDDFDDDAPALKPKRAMTEGAGNGRPAKSGRGYADLPPEARAQCDKWVKGGVIKSKEDFVKSFDFDGWNKAAR